MIRPCRRCSRSSRLERDIFEPGVRAPAVCVPRRAAFRRVAMLVAFVLVAMLDPLLGKLRNGCESPEAPVSGPAGRGGWDGGFGCEDDVGVVDEPSDLRRIIGI